MMTSATSPSIPAGERDELLAELRHARSFLRYTAKDLTDEQAARRTTVSALSIGGLVKHVADTERGWAGFVVSGPRAISGERDFADWTAEDFARREQSFSMQPGETIAGLLAAYAEVAEATDELLFSLPSLDARQPLPRSPWSSADSQSARATFLHIIAETSQHAGHADIIRESLDGQKTMG